MSEAPPLPDSDDPFEILGVARGVDARELRRAYVRLIRMHRPDRAPEQFARVRRAYEAATAEAEWQARWGASEAGEGDVSVVSAAVGSPEHGTEDAREGTETAAEPDVSAARGGRRSARAGIERAWRDLASGRSAADVLCALGEPLDDAQTAMHRALIAEVGGLGYRAEVLAGLQRGWPVAEWLADVLTERELHALVSHEAFAWERLREQEDREAAAWLMRCRLHVLLARGRLDHAVAEVLDDTFVDDAAMLPLLEWAAQEVSAVAAWARMNVLDRLDRRYGAEASEEWAFLSPQDHGAAARALRKPWSRWRAQYPTLKDLRRFFVLAPLLHGALQAAVADRLAADFMHRPEVYATAFTSLSASEPELLERFVLAAEGAAPLREAPDALDLDRSLLDQAERSILRLRRLGASTVAYEITARPAVTKLVVLEGLSPDRILELLEEDQHRWRHLSRFTPEIGTDRPLSALHGCYRLGREWSTDRETVRLQHA